MEQLPPYDASKVLPKTTRKSAENWAHQLFKQFPSLTATNLTSEFIEGVTQVLEIYPEAVLAVVCSSAFGVAAKQDFFPTLNQLRKSCDDAAFELSERDRRMGASRRKPAPRTKENFSDCYTGPIENIQPGDILHSTRIPEYREFMKKKHNIQEAKLWGRSEDWKDSGQRPFDGPLSIKPEEPNPFEK